MSKSIVKHPDDMGKVFSNTLEDLRWARISELMYHGADERSADLFARLEIEKKKQLAAEIGHNRALLSNLVHEFEGKHCWYCSVRYEAPPEGFWDRVFCGFRN